MGKRIITEQKSSCTFETICDPKVTSRPQFRQAEPIAYRADEQPGETKFELNPDFQKKFNYHLSAYRKRVSEIAEKEMKIKQLQDLVSTDPRLKEKL